MPSARTLADGGAAQAGRGGHIVVAIGGWCVTLRRCVVVRLGPDWCVVRCVGDRLAGVWRSGWRVVVQLTLIPIVFWRRHGRGWTRRWTDQKPDRRSQSLATVAESVVILGDRRSRGDRRRPLDHWTAATAPDLWHICSVFGFCPVSGSCLRAQPVGE